MAKAKIEMSNEDFTALGIPTEVTPDVTTEVGVAMTEEEIADVTTEQELAARELVAQELADVEAEIAKELAAEKAAGAWSALMANIQKPVAIDPALLQKKAEIEAKIEFLMIEVQSWKIKLSPVLSEIREAEKATAKSVGMLAGLAKSFGIEPSALGLPEVRVSAPRVGGKSTGLRLTVNGKVYNSVADTPSTVIAHTTTYCGGMNTLGRLGMSELYSKIPGGSDAYAKGGWTVQLERIFPDGHERAGQAEQVIIEGIMIAETAAEGVSPNA